MRPDQMIEKEASRPIEGIVRPFQRFATSQASGGILLLACTVLALFWANSPWSASYARLWHTHGAIGIGSWTLDLSLRHWINDGLMAVFFFVVGLEIKREVLVGELSTRRQAMLPIVAATGGMVVPAIIYIALNAKGEAAHGWGIPMATDIAFAIGILALLGRRVPTSLKLFLTAVAIVDDLGAILVIALGYTENLSFVGLLSAAGFLLALVSANRWLEVRNPLPYTLLGVGLWGSLLHSGVHPTLAGVLTAFTIPARTLLEHDEFLGNAHRLLHEFERRGDEKSSILEDERRLSAVLALEVACEQTETPLQRLEHALQPWVTHLIMPLFALANAGIPLRADAWQSGFSPIIVGIFAGLLLGKQLGVTLFAWLAVRTGAAGLPAGATWYHIYGVSWLAGIGFTMSIFIAQLAFPGSARLDEAKLGILIASLVAAVGGLWILRRADRS